jgi:hypothetical protein
MSKHDYALFVMQDRTAGFRDRSEAFAVAIRLPQGRSPRHMILTRWADRETADADLEAKKIEAGHLLYEEHMRTRR